MQGRRDVYVAGGGGEEETLLGIMLERDASKPVLAGLEARDTGRPGRAAAHSCEGAAPSDGNGTEENHTLYGHRTDQYTLVRASFGD